MDLRDADGDRAVAYAPSILRLGFWPFRPDAFARVLGDRLAAKIVVSVMSTRLRAANTGRGVATTETTNMSGNQGLLRRRRSASQSLSYSKREKVNWYVARRVPVGNVIRIARIDVPSALSFEHAQI